MLQMVDCALSWEDYSGQRGVNLQRLRNLHELS